MKLKMTATGDAILSQGYPKGGYEGQKALQDFIGRAAVPFPRPVWAMLCSGAV